MSFKANLFDLLARADRVSLDGYEIDGDMLVFHPPSFIDPKDSLGASRYAVDLTQHLGGGETDDFTDQEVEVNDEGYAEARSTEGYINTFGFSMVKPITEEDLESGKIAYVGEFEGFSGPTTAVRRKA